jgi:hypothetical protein
MFIFVYNSIIVILFIGNIMTTFNNHGGAFGLQGHVIANGNVFVHIHKGLAAAGNPIVS